MLKPVKAPQYLDTKNQGQNCFVSKLRTKQQYLCKITCNVAYTDQVRSKQHPNKKKICSNKSRIHSGEYSQGNYMISTKFTFLCHQKCLSQYQANVPPRFIAFQYKLIKSLLFYFELKIKLLSHPALPPVSDP